MNELVVHIVTPVARDASLIHTTLTGGGVDAAHDRDPIALFESRRGRTLGPLLIAEESLTPVLIGRLHTMLEEQPPWSDLPLLILTTSGQETYRSRHLEHMLEPLGDPVLLERPIRPATLLGSVRAALRARQRQYQIRDTLAERDRALADLQHERETLEVIFNNIPVGVVMANASGAIVRWNPATETILRHAAIPSPDFDSYERWVAFHPDGSQVKGHEYPLARAITSGKPVPAEEVLYRRGDSSMGWISMIGAPLLDEGGAVQGGLVVLADVDERRRASEQLRTSEERFRRLIEKASVGVLIGDLTGGIQYLNPTLQELLGYTAEEVTRGLVRWDLLTPPEFADRDTAALNQLKSTGSAVAYEKVYLSKAGVRIPVLVGATLLPESEGEHAGSVAVFITDLSPQKQTEAALVQAEKLAAVGRLAASISHEINNPLEAVTNLLYLIRHQTLPDEARTYLLLAEQEIARVSQIAAQTLRFHRQSTRARAVTPRELIEPVLALYQGRLNNSHIDVHVHALEAQSVTCMEGDIRQVLNNLVANAIDSMRRGGKLVIRARNTRRRGVEGVRIAIADTGHGMPESTRRRIFEPFYTTKGINGTGLGLWISCGIIEKHRGCIAVRSSVVPERQGTVFSVFLPVNCGDVHAIAGGTGAAAATDAA